MIEFKDFVFNSPTSKIAAELLEAQKINLVMDNWFFREAGSKSSPPFHHDISYFDFEGSMIEPVERSFRQFGAKQTPYFSVSKTPSRLLKTLFFVKDMLKERS